MAALDYVVRRNNANTDTIPDAGSDLALLWDTLVDSVGSGITGGDSGASGVFTLGETGKFLVFCTDQEGTTDETNNERINTKMTLTLAGSELTEGYSTGYIRKNSTGSLESMPFSAAIIDVATTTGNGDELVIRKERIDTTAVGGRESDRIADRSGIMILKLDDSWNYGLYRGSAFSASGTDDVAVTADLDTTDEQDGTVFNRTTNTIAVNTSNLVLAIYSFKGEDATPSGRAEYQGRITRGGTVVDMSWSHIYLRTTDNSDWCGTSGCALWEGTGSSQDVELELVSREALVNDFEATLQLIELPAAAEAIIVSDNTATGNINAAATNFNWANAADYIDTDAFTFSSGQTNLDVDNAGDYIAMAGWGRLTYLAATRSVAASSFMVNTTEQEICGNATYNRNSNHAGFGSLNMGTLLTSLSADDSVHARHDRIGTNSTAAACAGGMALIRLSSLVGTITHTATGAPEIILPTSAGTAEIIKTATGAPEIILPTSAGVSLVVTDLHQEHYRFAEPITGAEHEAWPLVGSEDTSFEVERDTNIAIIVKLGNDGGQTGDNAIQLEYNVDGGGWNPVTASSSNVRVGVSGDSSDELSGVERLTASGRTFQTSVIDEGNGKTRIVFDGDSDIEYYFAITFRSAELGGGESIDFRIVGDDDFVTLDITMNATVAVNSATGAPSIILPTSSGAAIVGRSATGAPSVILPTSAGAAEITKPATGAPEIILPVAAGAAQITKTATGAPSIILPTSAGVAEIGGTASGAPEIILPVSAGAAQIIKTASGAPQLELIESAGAAEISGTASGAPEIILPTAAGTAEIIKPATGTPSIILPTAAGVAGIERNASGAPSIILPTSAGSANVGTVATADGAPSIILPTAAGAAIVGRLATGSPSIILPTSSGAAQITKTATGSPSIILPTSSGAAEILNPASGAPEIILPTSSGAAEIIKTADGTPSIILPTSSGVAGIDRSATGAPSIILPTSAGTADVTGSKSADGAPSIILPTSSGAAEITKPATGSPEIILPVSAGVAEITKPASGAPSVFLPVSAGAAEVVKTASGAPSVFLPTASGASEIVKTATGAPSIILPTAAGDAHQCSEILPPDTIAALVALSGDVTDIDEPVNSPDGNWLLLAA